MGCVYDKNKSQPDRGPNIYIRFKEPDGRWRSRPVGHVKPKGLTKALIKTMKARLWRQAKEVLAKIEGDIVAGRYQLADETQPRPEQDLFSEVGQAWVANRNKANQRDPSVHRSWKDDRSRMNNHLIPHFGDHEIGQVTTGNVREFISAKRGKLARQTIVNCLNNLSRMYNDLREAGVDVENPVFRLDRATRRSIGKPRDPRMTPFLITKEEIRSVHLALSGTVRVMFDVGVFAGLRTGEIRALRVSA